MFENSMNLTQRNTLIRLQQRRSFLANATRGVGGLALASLLNPSLLRAASLSAGTRPAPSAGSKPARWTGVIHPLRFAPKAKRVIFLTMAGGPSHLETL